MEGLLLRLLLLLARIFRGGFRASGVSALGVPATEPSGVLAVVLCLQLLLESTLGRAGEVLRAMGCSWLATTESLTTGEENCFGRIWPLHPARTHNIFV